MKLPLVDMSASWFLVSTYLIWIFGSKWTLWNNQPRATLWFLDTCLTVGLLPLMIILITASLSTTDTRLEKNLRLWRHSPHATIDQHLGFPFVWVWIYDSREQFPAAGLVGVLVLFDERNTSITTFHKSRASIQ